MLSLRKHYVANPRNVKLIYVCAWKGRKPEVGKGLNPSTSTDSSLQMVLEALSLIQDGFTFGSWQEKHLIRECLTAFIGET